MAELPRVAIAVHPRVKGTNDPQPNPDEIPPLKVLSFEEAFLGAHTTDAHFVCYFPDLKDSAHPAPPDHEWWRFNKPSLTRLRERAQDPVDLYMSMFSFDFDTPNHKPWGETLTKEDFEDLVASVGEEFPLLLDFTCLYYTAKGARFVYVLDQPVPVDKAEGMVRWFVYRLVEHGLPVDELCDWTRLFRLPKVVRDGEPTESQDYYGQFWMPESRLDVAKLGTATKNDQPQHYGEIREFEDPMPTPGSCSHYLEKVGPSGRMVMTDWVKAVRHRLKNRECFPCLFEDAPLASRGERNQTLFRYIGQVISMCWNIEGTCPEAIFGLFDTAISQLNDLNEASDREDWYEVAWDHIGRIWVREEAKQDVEAIRQQHEESRSEEVEDTIVSGMRSWCSAPELSSSEALAWARGRYIVNVGAHYYLIDEDGFYRPQGYTITQLISACQRHAPRHIKVWVPRADGEGLKPLTPQQIINSYTTIASTVAAAPSVEAAYIENIDQPNAVLHIPMYRRNPNLVPRYDAEVDQWLKHLAGDKHDDLCRWIAKALAFEEGPICALSIMGGQGVGKKLITWGMAECLESPAVATSADISSQYQYGLLESPILIVNEGWATGGGFNSKHIADSFRELVGGDPIVVNRRYMAPVTVRNPMRVMFMANNLDVIRMLASKRDLSELDREALAIRLLHFDVGDRASIWLRAKGGLAFTSKPGRRWIAPDAGGESDYIVARHFLWLHSQRNRWINGERLLVEGGGASELMFEMQTMAGNAPIVVEAIVKMLESKRTISGLHVDKDENRVYVLSSSILDYFRDHMKDSRASLGVVGVHRVLSGLTVNGAEGNLPVILKGKEDMGRKRWAELDLLKLYEAASRCGWKCSVLDGIVSNRRKMIGQEKRDVDVKRILERIPQD